MPLKLFFLPSFERSLKSLCSMQLKTIGKLLEALEAYYTSDCNLEEAKKIAPRFFYKQLRRPYYEAGVEKDLRIIIRRDKSKCTVILAGNHGQIKTFLKRV